MNDGCGILKTVTFEMSEESTRNSLDSSTISSVIPKEWEDMQQTTAGEESEHLSLLVEQGLWAKRRRSGEQC
jgi:lambda repressor-like predicted transcriptional regulator